MPACKIWRTGCPLDHLQNLRQCCSGCHPEVLSSPWEQLSLFPPELTQVLSGLKRGRTYFGDLFLYASTFTWLYVWFLLSTTWISTTWIAFSLFEYWQDFCSQPSCFSFLGNKNYKWPVNLLGPYINKKKAKSYPKSMRCNMLPKFLCNWLK